MGGLARTRQGESGFDNARRSRTPAGRSHRADRRGSGGSLDRPASGATGLAGGHDGRDGLAACLAVWWFVTRGPAEERIISPSKGLSSPAETFASFHSLWFDRALTRNLLTTLRRLALGFGLPRWSECLWVCFAAVSPGFRRSFLPMTLFGRNIPVAALIPSTFSLFGIGELQKIIFIFIACVAFVIWDTTRAVQEVGSQYIDTAYTLGAGTWQTIGKVLLPLALPSVFNSLRLDLRPGLWLHHAGGGGQIRRRDRRPG